MTRLYRPFKNRVPDSQYRDRLAHILTRGELVRDTPQGVGAYTCFGSLHPMVFEVQNGAPLITERKVGFWRAGIGEILAFANGVTDTKILRNEYGVSWWDAWATEKKCEEIGVPVGSLGPGSYGAAFHDFPTPDGHGFNQFAHVIEQLKNPKLHQRRTLVISPWIPFYNGWGGVQKAVVSPCHGWLHFRVLNGELSMRMDQRSADFPIGVPMNMIQYFALLLLVAQVCALRPSRFIHSFSDAHIYENQEDAVGTITNRESRRLPTLTLDPGVNDFFSARPHHFPLTDYEPHPAIANIPVAI